MARKTSFEIAGRQVRLSNLDKVLFPNAGLTKGDLIGYYERVAAVALPHFRDRPLSMERFPDGLDGEGFMQKRMPPYFPDWIDRAELPKQDGSLDHVVANEPATLVYLANQGVITPHLGLSRVDRIDRPDRMVFDLDPPGDGFAEVQLAARAIRDLLAEFGADSFVQITGSTGMHVVAALDRSTGFDRAREAARALAERLAARHPDRLTVEMATERRAGRVFLDYVRNAYGQTAVAPYAVRARPGGPIATPPPWDEALDPATRPDQVTIGTIFDRLERAGDPWTGIDRAAVSAEALARRLEDRGD